MKSILTSDEKLMAALVHGSVFLSFLGPIIPTLIWSFQRKKSEYVRFHALQALGFQALFFWSLFVAIFGIVFLSIFLAIPVGMLLERGSNSPVMVPFIIQPLIIIGIFGVFGLYFLFGFIGVFLCFSGKDFKYPLLGKWLEKYLRRGSASDLEINEVQEDNWVGGICHTTAILQLWGLVLPVIVWATQKDRSPRLKIQAMQSVVYQAVAFVAYLLWTMVYMFLFMGMMVFLIVGGSLSNGNELSAPWGFAIAIMFIVVILFSFLVNLIGPLYLLFALIAAISVIRGKEFRYPVIGRFVERRLMT